jgi:hypothetical protein
VAAPTGQLPDTQTDPTQDLGQTLDKASLALQQNTGQLDSPGVTAAYQAGQRPITNPTPSPTPEAQPPSQTPTSPNTPRDLNEDDLKTMQGMQPSRKLTEDDLGTMQAAQPKEQDPLKAMQDAYSDSLAGQYSVDELKQKYASGEIPDKDSVVQALQKRSNKTDPIQDAIDSSASNLTAAGGFAKGVGEGTLGLGKEALNFVTGKPDHDGPIASLLNTTGASVRELSVALGGIAQDPSSAASMRTILENRKANLTPEQYQQQLGIINHVADVEKRLYQAREGEPLSAIGGAGTPLGDTFTGEPQSPTAPLPQGVKPMDWKSNIDLLNEEKAAAINEFDPNYAQNRQQQAVNNVMGGTQTFGHVAQDLIGRGANALVRLIPGGAGVSATDLINRSKNEDQWSKELDDAKQWTQEGQKIAQGHQPYLPYQLPADYKPDPQKIQAVADTIPLALQGAIPIPTEELTGALTKGFLGFGSKAAEQLAQKGGAALAKNAKKFGLYEAMSSIGDASYIAATTGNIPAAAGRLATGIGLPAASYLGGKVIGSAGGAVANLLAKSASDSWATNGILPNLIRRGVQAPVGAVVGAVPYATMMGGTPEQFGQNIGTMAGLHLAGRAIPEMTGAARNILFDQLHNGANWGAKGATVPYKDYGTDHALDQQSESTIQNLPKQQQNLVNGVRNFFGDKAEIHVVPTGQSWTDAIAKDAPNSDGVSARGFYIPESNPGRIFIRSDSVPQALGWESGRLLHNLMPDPIRHQFNGAAAAAMGPDKLNSTTQQYFSNALGGDAAQHPNFDQLPTDEQVRNGTPPGPMGYTKEMMLNGLGADATRRIFNGQTVGQLTKDPSLMRTLRYGVGTILDKMGIPTTTGVNDEFYGVNPGLQASLLMEQHMRNVAQGKVATPTETTGTTAAPGPVPTTPSPGFKPSSDWQSIKGIDSQSLPTTGIQLRTNPKSGEVEARWAKPPSVEIPVKSTVTPTAAQPSTTTAAPQQQKEEAKGGVTTVEAPAETGNAPAPVKAAPDMEPVYDRIMQSEGPGSDTETEQGQHEMYGFRSKDDPEQYARIAQARLQFGAGSPEERAIVHQLIEQEASQAGADKFTDPGVRALVASMSHMRGPGGARAMVQGLIDGQIRESYGDLGQDTIDAINKMKPEDAIAHLRDIRERYDRAIYGDTPTQGGGTWWNRFNKGLLSRYDRESGEALDLSEGKPEDYQRSLAAARGLSYKMGVSHGSGKVPNEISAPETYEQHRARYEAYQKEVSEEVAKRAAQGDNLANQVMQEKEGPMWQANASPEVKNLYSEIQPSEYADIQRRMAALRSTQGAIGARSALDEQAPVLQAIQEAGGMPNSKGLASLGTFNEPDYDALKEAQAQFKALTPEQKLFLRQNYGITESKLFQANTDNWNGLEGLRYQINRRTGTPFETGQDVLDHYYDTLSNLKRLHEGLGPLATGQTQEVSQNVPKTSVNDRYSSVTLPNGQTVFALREPLGEKSPVVQPVQGGSYEVVASNPSLHSGPENASQLSQLLQGIYEARETPEGTMLSLRESKHPDAPPRLLQTADGRLVVPGSPSSATSYRALKHHGKVPGLTPSQVSALRSAAAESVPRTTVNGRARDTSSKAYQNDVEKAQNEALLEAHQATLAPGDDRVQMYRDPDTGKVMATGNQIVPGDVAHDILTKGVSPEDIALANRFGEMSRTREPVTMTYGSAPRKALEGSERRTVRQIEQSMSPAAERAHGESKQELMTKTWVPRSISIGGLGTAGEKSVLLHGLSTDKLAQNLKMIQDAFPEGHPLKSMKENDWADAVNRYVANHEHGYKGDGSARLASTEKTKVKPDPKYLPQPVREDVAHAINMAMADEGAKGSSAKSEEAREFAKANQGYLEEGEVNPLRKELGDKVAKELTTPWETLRADLVHEIHGQHEAGPGRLREGSEPITEAVKQGGMPKSQYVRAGFMPEGEGIQSVRDQLKEKGIELDAYEGRHGIHVSRLFVPKEQRQMGLGSFAMKNLTDYADKTGQRIAMSPSTDFGASSVNRLRDFYKRFGFVDNKGRSKDFTISDSMYRDPSSPSRNAAFMPEAKPEIHSKLALLGLPDNKVTRAIATIALRADKSGEKRLVVSAGKSPDGQILTSELGHQRIADAFHRQGGNPDELRFGFLTNGGEFIRGPEGLNLTGEAADIRDAARRSEGLKY